MPRVLLSPESRSARARLASHASRCDADDEKVVESRRDFKAARLADYIRAVVDEAPPLTPEQRSRLAVLLRGGDAA